MESAVGPRSTVLTSSPETPPPSRTPGQRTIIGTWMPASYGQRFPRGRGPWSLQ
jgi:hypothetical protein